MATRERKATLHALVSCAAGVLLIGSLAACNQAAHQAEKPINPAAHPDNGMNPAATQVVVIGDSLSTGYGTSPGMAWPTLLQTATTHQPHPLQIINAAKNGSGYLSTGDDGQTFASEVSGAVTAQTRVVVFFGSENDMGSNEDELKQAASEAYAQVRATAPEATIIVIGPPSYTDAPEAERLQVRDQDQAAALEAGAIFIDPIQGQWIMGHADELIGSDGDHPSEQGQHYLENKMENIINAPYTYGQRAAPGQGQPPATP